MHNQKCDRRYLHNFRARLAIIILQYYFFSRLLRRKVLALPFSLPRYWMLASLGNTFVVRRQ
jgi:hypothetical protein